MDLSRVWNREAGLRYIRSINYEGSSGSNIECDNIVALMNAATYNATRSTATSYAQFGQDRLLYDFFEGKTNGTFVDIGAGEAIHYSNTYGLESQFGWTGVLVELDPIRRKDLQENRKALLFPDALKWNATSSNINEILAATNKTHIEYFSLDVDGPELEAIKYLDFNKYSFDLLNIEHDIYRPKNYIKRKKIKEIVEQAGYEYLISISVDDFYVPRGIVTSINKEYGYNFEEILGLGV